MQVTIEVYREEQFEATAQMITQLMNYHRGLTNAPQEFWQTDEESEETLKEWLQTGTVYHVLVDGQVAGFFYLRFGGQSAAWLEDVFISGEYRGQGVGKVAIAQLDELMLAQGIKAMFVDVIPRNTGALKFYRECGFDHLNLIQLRKNYDERLNKTEEIEILGQRLKKY